MLYQLLYQHVLAHIDAEQIHDLTVNALGKVGSFPPTRSLMRGICSPAIDGLSISALGLNFAHPLGLAAGFDKNACCFPAMNALGFSFVEVGTVTPLPQPGNPGKRIFRLIADDALINRMGFPNAGMQIVERNLNAQRDRSYPVGVSLGKNKATPLEDAHEDYCAVLKRLYSSVDFFVVNVSSPNTPNLRKLQDDQHLTTLLSHVTQTIRQLAGDQAPKPVLIKLSPDLTWHEIDTLLDVALSHQVRGVIATNTTTRRDGLSSAYRNEPGGLSGRPLRQRSTELIRYIAQRTQGKLCIIGVGGIFSGSDVWEKMCAGATLVQAYTGLIYEGPLFVRTVIDQLHQLMQREGVDHLVEIIGAERELSPYMG